MTDERSLEPWEAQQLLADRRVRAEEQQQARAARANQGLKLALETVEGREFLAALLDATGVYAATGAGDHAGLAEAQGRRRVGLDLRAWIERVAGPRAYFRMMMELQPHEDEGDRLDRISRSGTAGDWRDELVGARVGAGGPHE